MAKSTRRDEPIPPSISKEEGLHRLKLAQQRGHQILADRPLKTGSREVWSDSTIAIIRAIYGTDNNLVSTFIGPTQVIVAGGYSRKQTKEEIDAEKIQRRCEVLQSMIEQLESEIGPKALSVAPQNDSGFWEDIHPAITQVARPRYEDGHFADAVEAALKDLNQRVKEMVRRKTAQEFDGAELMRRAFTPNNPVILLADLATDSGKSVQQGYMDIAAGAMTGIRNPKAHANLNIDAKRARHHIYLASLLSQVVDERI